MKKEKVIKTPEQIAKGRKKGLIITAIVLASIFVFIGFLATISAISCASLNGAIKKFDAVSYESQKTPVKDEDGYWTFTSDNGFKVLQITDVHIGAGFLCNSKDKSALNAVACMITTEKPDLVITTGDIAYPVPYQAGTFNNKNAAEIYANLMEELGVYWTVSFGNHDTEAYSYYNREEISEFYSQEKFKHCLFEAGSKDIDGFGNQVIKVKNSHGLITQALFVFDSHAYLPDDKFGIKWHYDNIRQSQVDWYANNVKSFNQKNASTLASLNLASLNIDAKDFTTVKSLAFFHIPLEEYLMAYKEYLANDMKDTTDVSYNYGRIGETGNMVYCGSGSDNLFETMLELQSTKGIFVGHDHFNNISLTYKGIRLTYGMSIDYLAYPGIHKIGKQRGCTIINIDNLGNFDCQQSSYYQDKYQPVFKKEVVDMEK
ncbi:MAG: metallophosphoesterase [Clostridia bacterium]